MLIDGMKINIPFEKDIILPRIEKDVVLHAIAVPYEEEFDELCPSPSPTEERDLKGNLIRYVYDDPKYRKKVMEYTKNKVDFLVIKTISNVNWERVDVKDPSTWCNWRSEALESGITEHELGRIVQEVSEAYSPTQESIKKAREDFLAGQDQETKDK